MPSICISLVFSFASHWKQQKRSFRTLTKAFGLRFIISVSGQAGRFDVIQLSLNIGSLIGILGLATFVCDLVALYVHRQSDVYRQQKFQDVDLNLVRLETLNSLPLGMMSEESRRKHENHAKALLAADDETVGNHKTNHGKSESPHRELSRRHKTNNHLDSSTAADPYHQQHLGMTNALIESPPPPPSTSAKQRRSLPRSPQLTYSSPLTNDRNLNMDKVNIVFVEDDSSPHARNNRHDGTRSGSSKKPVPSMKVDDDPPPPTRPTPKIETFL